MTETVDKIKASIDLILAFKASLPRAEENATIADIADALCGKKSTANGASLAFSSAMIAEIPKGKPMVEHQAQELFVIGMAWGVFLSETGRAKFLLREKS